MSLRRNFAQAIKGAIGAIPEAQQIVERNRAIGAENYRNQFNEAPDYQAKQEVANQAATKGNFLQRQGTLADTMNTSLERTAGAATRMGNTALQGYQQKLGSFTEATTPEQAGANISDLQALQAKADADAQQLTAKGADVSGINKFREQVTSEINRLRTTQKAMQDEKEKDNDFKEVGMSTLRELVGSSVTDINQYRTMLGTIGLTGEKANQMALTMVSLAQQIASKTAAAQNREDTRAMMTEISSLMKTKDPIQLSTARDIAVANGHQDIADNITKVIATLTPDSKTAKEEVTKDLNYFAKQAAQGILLAADGSSIRVDQVQDWYKENIWDKFKRNQFKDHYTVSDYGNLEDAANAYKAAIERGADRYRTFDLLTEGVPMPMVDRLRQIIGQYNPPESGAGDQWMFNPPAPQIAGAGR